MSKKFGQCHRVRELLGDKWRNYLLFKDDNNIENNKTPIVNHLPIAQYIRLNSTFVFTSGGWIEQGSVKHYQLKLGHS